MLVPGIGPARRSATSGTRHDQQYPNSVEIDRVHSVAICLEIGERLGGALTATPTRLPPRLAELLDILECNNVSFGIPAENEQK